MAGRFLWFVEGSSCGVSLLGVQEDIAFPGLMAGRFLWFVEGSSCGISLLGVQEDITFPGLMVGQRISSRVKGTITY